MKTLRYYLMLVCAMTLIIACNDDKENIPRDSPNPDPVNPYFQLAGSISGSYLIQGELLWGDTKFELNAEDQIDLMPPATYCVFSFHDPKTTVRYSCMLSIDDKMYTLTVPPFEVSGELWHVDFNTKTTAELYEGDKQIAEGTFSLVGSMDLIGTPPVYPMDYDCNLEILFESEFECCQMNITRLLSRNRD